MKTSNIKAILDRFAGILSPVCGVIASLLMLGDWINVKILSLEFGISSISSTVALKGTSVLYC